MPTKSRLPSNTGSHALDPTDAHIRPATAKDVPVVHALLLDLARSLNEADSMRATENDLAREGFGPSPGFHVLLAERDTKPLGMTLFFKAYSSWRGRPGLYVQDLHIIASERGTGLGQCLLAAAARMGIDAGCNHLRLSVAVSNRAGRGFYNHMGLQERDDEMVCQISDSAFEALAKKSSFAAI